ncbi:MAG: von Willebrand factor type A domain-containing protein, partial [Hyphomicrobiaceae bacterium]|nr:von Willebrand factor type A domain-containing protein [Hyphomicrobiaceae bacterium]
MTEDIKKLKAAFSSEPPISPRKAAKKLAIEQAMAAFDEKNLHSSQGTGLRTRLMDTASSVYETLIGRRPMRLNPALAGGASLSVMLIAALSATYINTGSQNVPVTIKKSPPPPVATDSLADRLKRPGENVQQKETFESAVKLNRADENKRAAEKREIDRLSSQPSIAAPKVARQSQDYTIMPPAPAGAGRPLAFGAPATGSASVQRRITAAPQQFRLRRITKPDLPAPGYYEDQGRDRFENVASNSVKVVSEDPVSTFSIDVDTASYSFMRSSLNSNVLPQKAAIRVEELINYFPYDYARPDDKSVPFKASVSVFPSPWNTDRKLMHIGIAGFDLKAEEKPHSNLVFLLDTSGSMNAPNKLPLMVNSMK